MGILHTQALFKPVTFLYPADDFPLLLLLSRINFSNTEGMSVGRFTALERKQSSQL